MKDLLITIDGPAGAGKTTVSRMLAARLGYSYVDTGALYRAIAYAAKTARIASDDAALEELCRKIKLEVIPRQDGFCLMLDGIDISDKIRTPEITMLASAISARPVVRKYLLYLQRELGRNKRCVFEGRDMGTVVFPDADMKFFLSASLKMRADRRYEELKAKTGQTREEVEKDMACRDKNDSSRDIAPLVPAKDAVMIDSTNLSAEEVVSSMIRRITHLI
jgi:cytidylate kinase